MPETVFSRLRPRTVPMHIHIVQPWKRNGKWRTQSPFKVQGRKPRPWAERLRDSWFLGIAEGLGIASWLQATVKPRLGVDRPPRSTLRSAGLVAG